MSIEEQIEMDLEINVNRMLNGSIKFYSSKFIYPQIVVKHLTELGFVENYDMDTNGWQYDYWFSMTHPEHGKYRISGCGFYGGLTISKEDEED